MSTSVCCPVWCWILKYIVDWSDLEVLAKTHLKRAAEPDHNSLVDLSLQKGFPFICISNFSQLEMQEKKLKILQNKSFATWLKS